MRTCGRQLAFALCACATLILYLADLEAEASHQAVSSWVCDVAG